MQIGDPENCRMGDERYTHVPIIHYTNAQALGEDGQAVPIPDAFWNWDKRSDMVHYPKVPLDPPPEGGPETVKQIISQINEAAMSREFAAFWRAHTDLSKE